MAPRMPNSKKSFSKAPGYVKPASASANKKAGVPGKPKSSAPKGKSVGLHPPAPKTKSKVPIVGSGAGPKKPKNIISPSSGSDSYVRVHAPSGATTSSPSTSSPTSLPGLSSAPSIMDEMGKAFGFEGIRGTPTSTTNGMTNVDEYYKFKSLQAFADFKI